MITVDKVNNLPFCRKNGVTAQDYKSYTFHRINMVFRELNDRIKYGSVEDSDDYSFDSEDVDSNQYVQEIMNSWDKADIYIELLDEERNLFLGNQSCDFDTAPSYDALQKAEEILEDFVESEGIVEEMNSHLNPDFSYKHHRRDGDWISILDSETMIIHGKGLSEKEEEGLINPKKEITYRAILREV
jgi:hypothetical protein